MSNIERSSSRSTSPRRPRTADGGLRNSRSHSRSRKSRECKGSHREVKYSKSRSRSVSRGRKSYRGSKYVNAGHRGNSRSRSPYRGDRYSRSRSRSCSRSRYSHERNIYRSRSRSPMSSRRRHVGNRDNPCPSRCLGVFGLSIFTIKQQIHDRFSKYGPVERVQVVIDAKTGRSRGFCFVYFESSEDAKVAKEQCTGMEIDGKRIRVESIDFSITQRAHTPTPGIYMGKPTHLHERSWDGPRRREVSYRGSYRRSPSPYYSRRRTRYERSRSRSYTPLDEVQQRWKRLKDRYTKERRLNENATHSGSGIQQNKQWPLFESLKFLEKHIQRRRTFSNVPLQFRTKSQDNASEELNFSHPKKKFSEKQLEGLKRGFSNWQNCESLTSKTLNRCVGAHKSFISLASTSTSTSDISEDSVRFSSSTPTYENVGNTAVHSGRTLNISDCNEINLSPNELRTPHSVDEDVSVAKLSTAVTPSLPTIPTKCFSSGVQRKIKNKPDVLETSFVNAINAFKEYMLEIKGEKENFLPADEYFAKFIVSRLSQLPEENRDEKRKKIIDVLLSK